MLFLFLIFFVFVKNKSIKQFYIIFYKFLLKKKLYKDKKKRVSVREREAILSKWLVEVKVVDKDKRGESKRGDGNATAETGFHRRVAVVGFVAAGHRVAEAEQTKTRVSTYLAGRTRLGDEHATRVSNYAFLFFL